MWLHYQKEEIQTLKFYCTQSGDSGTSLQDINKMVEIYKNIMECT